MTAVIIGRKASRRDRLRDYPRDLFGRLEMKHHSLLWRSEELDASSGEICYRARDYLLPEYIAVYNEYGSQVKRVQQLRSGIFTQVGLRPGDMLRISIELKGEDEDDNGNTQTNDEH